MSSSYRSISLVLAFLAGAIMLPQGKPLYSQEQLRRRVMDEVPRAYKRYGAFALTLQGRVDIREHINHLDKKQTVDTWRYLDVKMNKDCASSLIQFMNEDRPEGTLVVQNPSYRFQLKRKTCNAEWVLTLIDRNVNEGKLDGNMSASAEVHDTLHYAYKIYELNLLDVLSEKNSAKVAQVSAVKRDGKEVVQVDFDNAHPSRPLEGGTLSPTQGGTFWLDPSLQWCVVECKLRAEWGGPTKAEIASTCSYAASKHGMPIPQKVRRKTTTQPGARSPFVWEERTDFDLRENDEPPADGEFSLAAYGLSERAVPAHETRRHSLVVATAVGLGLVILGFILWRIAKTRKARFSKQAP